MEIGFKDQDGNTEKKFKQNWKLGRRICEQSITVGDTLIWEDSHDTMGTKFDIESTSESEKFDKQAYDRQQMD